MGGFTERLVLQGIAFSMSRKAARNKPAELLNVVGLDDVFLKLTGEETHEESSEAA